MKSFKKLSREELRNTFGGFRTWCSNRHSANITDLRAGGQVVEQGFLNQYGCWIYPGMSWNSRPECGPGTACYHLGGNN